MGGPLSYKQLSVRRAEIIDEGSGLIPDLAKMVEAYLFNPYVSVSVGGSHTCGLKADGVLSCWGWNAYGQTTVPPGVYTQVSAGTFHTCALKADGSLSCWGYNTYGQTTVPPGVYTQVSAGDSHTCGLKADGSLSCWGWNAYGQTQVPLPIF